MRKRLVLSFATCTLAILIIAMGCRTAPPPLESVYDTSKLAEIDAAILRSISSNQIPGAVLWLEHHGISYHKAFGQLQVYPTTNSMPSNAIFDAASLTKVMATTPSILLLVQEGKLNVDAPVATYLPKFNGPTRSNITVRHLMTHSSGLRPGLSLAQDWSGTRAALDLATAEDATTPPGTQFRYSDINFILLGELVARVSGQPLDIFAKERIYRPLRMTDTGFRPPATARARIAPTERIGDSVLRGTVHDPTARRMGGVAGHAGLFTTAHDLARYARMLLHGGALEGVRIFNPETVRLMTTVQSPANLPARGLGWDIDSPYAGARGKNFPMGSYGHTGWTGTSIWIDPFSDTFVILLTNRNHPTEEGSVLALRSEVATYAAEALRNVQYGPRMTEEEETKSVSKAL